MEKEKDNSIVLCRGIDCAPKVIAYTYAKNLMERGISGQPLYWKLMKKHYVCGYVTSYGFFNFNRKDLRLEPGVEPLWRPKEVPEDIWSKAVECFTPLELEENLLRHLLPLLGDIKELISREKLLDLTERLFVEKDIYGWLVRRRGADVYYFNEQGIYTKGVIEDIQEDPATRKLRHSPWYDGRFNQTIWNKAASQFCEGDTLRSCIEVFFQTELTSTPLNYTYLDRLVTRIEPAEYERVPENNDPNTFDRIRVQVNLSYTLHQNAKELSQAVRKYRKKIDGMVLSQIEHDRRFRRFSVPVNILKLGAFTLYGHTLEYIFEIKESGDTSISEAEE